MIHMIIFPPLFGSRSLRRRLSARLRAAAPAPAPARLRLPLSAASWPARSSSWRPAGGRPPDGRAQENLHPVEPIGVSAAAAAVGRWGAGERAVVPAHEPAVKVRQESRGDGHPTVDHDGHCDGVLSAGHFDFDVGLPLPNAQPVDGGGGGCRRHAARAFGGRRIDGHARALGEVSEHEGRVAIPARREATHA